MSGTARPRPRPRPRPVPVVTEPPPPSTSTPPSSTANDASSSTAPQQQAEDDVDALFIRNQSRTASTWKQLNELDKQATRRAPRVVYSDEEDDDEEKETPRSRKIKKKVEKDSLPSWARMKAQVRFLSEDIDENAIEIVEKMKADKPPSKVAKRPRSKSRSRSITPPPALSVYQVEAAKAVVRQALNRPRRAPSPTFTIDDPMNSIPLEPELAEIALAIRQESSQSQSSTSEFFELQGPETVTIRVKWQPHPLDRAAKPALWTFKIKRHDTFRQLFEETADTASILYERLIVNYRNARLSPFATPNTLKIFSEAELEACDKTTYEYIREQRSVSPSAALSDEQQAIEEENSDFSDNESPQQAESESVGGEKFKLILRSAVTTKDITVMVRPTTTCGAIVTAFLKAAGLEDKYSKSPRERGPILQIDGEKMNPSDVIGEAGLEDGDCVDVIEL